MQTFAKVLRVAKPASIYIQDLPPNIGCGGGYTTATRENADVLSLDSEQAADELVAGPPDGKRILIRNRGDHRRQSIRLVDYIKKYRAVDVDVQDPRLPASKYSCRPFSPQDIAHQLQRVCGGIRRVGYNEEDDIPPYNLLSLPSYTLREPSCLTKTDLTRAHQLLRISNALKNTHCEETEPARWSLLAVHMAISLPHQDHDGLGTFLNERSGYKIWVFWLDLTDSTRKQFHKQGGDFVGTTARYVVLGPNDHYIQTPVVSQDVHAVLSIGYCGVDKCCQRCKEWGYPPCDGLVAIDSMHYWHARFMADSVKSATSELKAEQITNQHPHLSVF